MAHTKVTKNGTQNTGTANTFSYSGSFDVFKASEVEVELDNVALTFTTSTINESASPREYTVDYNAKTVHIGGANLTSNDNVVIQPVTDMGAPTPRATYEPGASITSTDLNNNQLQLMRKAMEYNEQKLSSRGGTMTGNLHLGQNVDLSFEGSSDNAHETTLTVVDPTSDKTITFPDTTGTVVTTGDTGTVARTMIANDAINGDKIDDNSINSEHYVDGSIDSDHLSANVVTNPKIANNAVDTAHIRDLNVTTAKLAADAVTGAKIADDAIGTEHLQADSVRTADIKDLNVTTAKLAADAVTAAKLADDAVVTANIVDGEVTREKIHPDAIDSTKLADNAVNSEHYVDGSIDTAHIGNLQVTTAKIAADAITNAKIADDAIATEHIETNGVRSDNIQSQAVVTTKIADDAVTTAKIFGSAVTDAKLASNSVTETKITDANVTEAKLAANSVTISKIGCEQTTISDSDSHIPTSGAVVDYVAAQIAPLGGLEVIATDAAFPNAQPSSGVVISISDAGGVAFNGSGSSTTARTVGGSTVTINNAPSSLNNETLVAGVGLMVSSTGSSQTYNYHKILGKEDDIKQLSDDINDFNARYRVGSSNPSTNLDSGDLFFNTGSGKLLVYNGTASAWEEAQSIGQYFINTISSYSGTGGNSASFNNNAYRFVLSNPGSVAEQHIVSINGVIQKPNSGTSQPSEGFAIDGSSIIFSSAPATGSDFFIITIGSTVNIGTPSNGTVTTDKLTNGAVTEPKIASDAVTTAKLVDDAVTGAKIAAATITASNIAGNTINQGNIAANAVATSEIQDEAVTLAKLEHGTSSNNGKFLRANNGADPTFETVDLSSAFDKGGGDTITGDFTIASGTTNKNINVDVSDRIRFDDNLQATFGNSDDLKIYHDGTRNILEATNQLRLCGTTNVLLRASPFGDVMINAIADGAVELMHDNTKMFETTSSGCQIPTGYGLDVHGGTGSRSDDAVVFVDKTNNNDWCMKLDCGVGSSTDYGLQVRSPNAADYVYTIYDTTNSGYTFRVQGNGTVISGDHIPLSNNNHDLGSSSTRWRNVYTNDLHLSNEGSSNDVDGTWGDWTIQEGESDLFLKNNRSGKKYKFNLTEVS